MDVGSRRHKDLEVGQGQIEGCATLGSGRMRNDREPWVIDVKRGAGYIGISPDCLQGRLWW